MKWPLHPKILKEAYTKGFFPMPDPTTGEILWFRPNPRAILPLDGFHCSRSLFKRIKKADFSIKKNKAFENVMKSCADRNETWITKDFIEAYCELNKLGFAHSLEVWKKDKLIGGVYGVSIQSAFFAESMFHLETDASKIALYFLVQHLSERNFVLLEVQFLTPHLQSLGAVEISDNQYQSLLSQALSQDSEF